MHPFSLSFGFRAIEIWEHVKKFFPSQCLSQIPAQPYRSQSRIATDNDSVGFFSFGVHNFSLDLCSYDDVKLGAKSTSDDPLTK